MRSKHPVRLLAFAFLALFVATFAFAALGQDVGCDDDCERGAACRVVCVACGCSALTSSADTALFLQLATQRLASPAFAETPLSGIALGVLHVPLAV